MRYRKISSLSMQDRRLNLNFGGEYTACLNTAEILPNTVSCSTSTAFHRNPAPLKSIIIQQRMWPHSNLH